MGTRGDRIAGGRVGSSGPWGIRAQPQRGAHLFHSRGFRGSQVGSVGTEKEKPAGPQGAGSGLWEKEPGWVGASGRARLRYLPAGLGDPKARGRGGRRAAVWKPGSLRFRDPAPRPPLGTAPPGPGPPPPRRPFPPGGPPLPPRGVRARAAASVPRDRSRPGARGSAGKATRRTRHGAASAESLPTRATRTSQVLGAAYPEELRRRDFSKCVRAFEALLLDGCYWRAAAKAGLVSWAAVNASVTLALQRSWIWWCGLLIAPLVWGP